MPKWAKTDSQRLLEVLQDILIVELGRAGVRQLEIRKIVGVDIHRVNRIMKHVPVKKGWRGK